MGCELVGSGQADLQATTPSPIEYRIMADILSTNRPGCGLEPVMLVASMSGASRPGLKTGNLGLSLVGAEEGFDSTFPCERQRDCFY